MSVLNSHYTSTISCLPFSDLCAFPHVSNAAVFANPHFLPSAALWHPLIPSLHFPYSLSPSMAFLFQTHMLTHMQTLLSSFSVSLSPSPSLLFSLFIFLLHLSTSPVFSMPLTDFLFTCSSHTQLSAPPSSRAAVLMKEALLAEPYKSDCQRSYLPALPHIYRIDYTVVINETCLTP